MFIILKCTEYCAVTPTKTTHICIDYHEQLVNLHDTQSNFFAVGCKIMQHYVIQLYNIMQHYIPRRYIAAYSPPNRRKRPFLRR